MTKQEAEIELINTLINLTNRGVTFKSKILTPNLIIWKGSNNIIYWLQNDWLDNWDVSHMISYEEEEE